MSANSALRPPQLFSTFHAMAPRVLSTDDDEVVDDFINPELRDVLEGIDVSEGMQTDTGSHQPTPAATQQLNALRHLGYPSHTLRIALFPPCCIRNSG